MAVALVVFTAGGVSASTSALSPNRVIAELCSTGDKFEREGNWAKACEKYDEILRLDRGRSDIRRRFQECFRRLQQARRHRDPSYKHIASLKYSHALQLYEMMLASLQAHYVDRRAATPARMYQGGVEELRAALKSTLLRDSVFRGNFLAHVQDDDIRLFISQLTRKWLRPELLKSIRTSGDAAEQVRQVAMAAQRPARFGGLDLSASVVVLEFACGACTVLDEYTFYLTPSQFSRLTAAVRGSKFVGVGIDLCRRDDKIVIVRVLRGSPAARANPPLKVDDEIIRIDDKAVYDLSAEAAMDLLKGDSGTTVDLQIVADGMMDRQVTLERKKLTPQSVDFGWLTQRFSMSEPEEKPDLGYIQIFNFQRNTPQELDSALLALKEGGVKGLILDLRGNAGGSFEAAVACARRFLSGGVIVTTKGPNAKISKHLVRNGSLVVPVTVPLVVLVDEDTASAAEVLAAALKENGGFKVVGQRTFGKGCSQRLLQLTVARGGAILGALRVTVAKFLSPSGEAFNGRGVTPTHLVERHIDPSGMDDHQLFEAKKLLREAIPRPMSLAMPMGIKP
jgi:carboxyl-terminal processing protease